MDFLPHVVRATHERGFRIRLKFNDGVEGSVDFEQWLVGEVFEPLKKPCVLSESSSSTAARSCGQTGRTSRPKHCTKPPVQPGRCRPTRGCTRRRPRSEEANSKRTVSGRRG